MNQIPRYYAIIKHVDGGTVRIGPYCTDKLAQQEMKWQIGRSKRLEGYIWHNKGLVNL